MDMDMDMDMEYMGTSSSLTCPSELRPVTWATQFHEADEQIGNRGTQLHGLRASSKIP